MCRVREGIYLEEADYGKAFRSVSGLQEAGEKNHIGF